MAPSKDFGTRLGVCLMEDIHTIVSLWPLALGFVTLVIVLAKMHSAIEVINEKIKVLFDLYNKDRKK